MRAALVVGALGARGRGGGAVIPTALVVAALGARGAGAGQ